MNNRTQRLLSSQSAVAACKKALLMLLGLAFSLPVLASSLYMEPGDSQVIKTQGNVDTVFIASPDVADYEILGDNSVVIYAQKEGSTKFSVFNKAGKELTSATLVVNEVISSLNKKIQQITPGSTVTLDKVGKSYVLNGTVTTEADRDRIYRIVGEGIGANKTIYSPKDEKDKKINQPWLDKTVYDGVVNNLTLPAANQVNVKLSIVEVTKEFSDNVGIDWATLGSEAGSFSFIKKFDAGTLAGVIHAIGNDSVARVLAEPNLSVLSGEMAHFLVGGEVPLITSSINGTSVIYKDYGIKLSVGAKVMNRDRIRLMLQEEVSSVDQQYQATSGSSFPALLTRRAASTVELADGQSFILGGLLSNEESEQLSKIPLIGDVPILGAFFRNTATERRKRELVVIATVNLVKPVSAQDVILPDYQRTSTWMRLLNFSAIDDIRSRRQAKTFVEKGGFIK